MQNRQKAKRGRPTLVDMAARIDTRAGLLQAARNLMLSSDSVDFSLSQIAGLTGQSPALVQYHFGSKQGLLLALIELDAAKAVQEMQGLTALDLPVAKKMRLHIGGMVNAYFEAPYANRLLHALMQGPNAQAVSEIFLQPIANFQRALLKQGESEGVFRAVDPMGFFFIILGSCDQFFSRRGKMAHVFGVDDISEEVKRGYMQTLTEVVMAGIAAE